PDVILAHGASTVGPVLQATRTAPILFPVASGFVSSQARPGGNVTGFMSNDFSISGKWLELLQQIAPSVTRAAVLRDATQGSGTTQFAVIQAVAPALRMEVNPIGVGDPDELRRDIMTFARSSSGGL